MRGKEGRRGETSLIKRCCCSDGGGRGGREGGWHRGLERWRSTGHFKRSTIMTLASQTFPATDYSGESTSPVAETERKFFDTCAKQLETSLQEAAKEKHGEGRMEAKSTAVEMNAIAHCPPLQKTAVESAQVVLKMSSASTGEGSLDMQQESIETRRPIAAPTVEPAKAGDSNNEDVKPHRIVDENANEMPEVAHFTSPSVTFPPLELEESILLHPYDYVGPTDESNWVIPGLLLVGAYPSVVSFCQIWYIIV